VHAAEPGTEARFGVTVRRVRDVLSCLQTHMPLPPPMRPTSSSSFTTTSLIDTRHTENKGRITLPGPFGQRPLDGKLVTRFQRVDIL
jgi:hypothetical protein